MTLADKILIDTADAIIESAFIFEVPVAPQTWYERLLKLLGKFPLTKEFVIKPSTLVTMARLSKQYKLIDASATLPLYESVEANTYRMAYIIACAVHNGVDEPPKKLSNFFFEHLESKELERLTSVIHKKMGLEAFTNSIIFIGSQSILTDPHKMTPTDQRS